MEKKIRSVYEKEMICAAFAEQEKLPFPTYTVNDDIFVDEEVYNIPSDCIEEVLKKCWFFADVPSINEERFDIHEEAVFHLKDIQVIRYNNRNIIVSPYYFKSGGCIVDFINVDEVSRGVHVEVIKR